MLADSKKLRFIRSSFESRTPRKFNDFAAGYDLYSTGAYTIKPGGLAKVDTGIKVKLPHGYAGLIKGRSGMALKSTIDVMGKNQK